MQQLCNIWRIKARQILFIVKQKFFVLYLTHLGVVDFKKKNRVEERAKENQKATGKNYEDYAWKDLCEDLTKLKKLRVPELNNMFGKSHDQKIRN